jgi:hypothetical protein
MSISDLFLQANGRFCPAEATGTIFAPICNLIVKQSDGTECLKWNSVKDRSKRPICKYTDENGTTTREAEIVIVAVKNAINGMPYCFAIFDPRTDKWLEATATFSGVIIQDIRGKVTHWAELPPLEKEGTE